MLFRPPGFYASNAAAMGGAEAFSIAGIAVGWWLAEDLASQTESDASPPEAGDQVYTDNNLAVTSQFSQAARVTTGPTLAAAGTSYYWDNTSATGLSATRTPAALTADVFIICRNLGGDANAEYVADAAGSELISAQNGSSSPISNWGGTCTVDGGSTLTTETQLYAAIGTTAWRRVRLASADLAALDSIAFPRSGAAIQMAACAVIPSATLATGTNLADTIAELDAIMARLNA